METPLLVMNEQYFHAADKGPGPECDMKGKLSGTSMHVYLEHQNLKMCLENACTATDTIAHVTDNAELPSHPDE